MRHGRRTTRPNGASAVSVKQSLLAVLGYADRRRHDGRPAGHADRPPRCCRRKLANGGRAPQSSGTAWAAITAPGVASIWDKTAVEARVDPAQEQSKLGTSLSKSVPLSEQYSLTLQNGYNVIQQGIVPVPGIVSHPARSYETDQSAKLSIADTGTSFMAGQTLSTSRRQMAAQDRRRAETVRRRHRLRLGRRDADRRRQQELQRRLQAQLVERFAPSSPLPHRMIQHCRILAQMRSKSAAQMAPLHFVVRGTSALA